MFNCVCKYTPLEVLLGEPMLPVTTSLVSILFSFRRSSCRSAKVYVTRFSYLISGKTFFYNMREASIPNDNMQITLGHIK